MNRLSALKMYEVTLIGREKNVRGKRHKIVTRVAGRGSKDAELNLYERYSDIHLERIEEIKVGK